MVRAVVGANWGDEGKGKITDMLGQESDIIVRFQGGANAGHTIVNNYGKFALHTLPSGIFYGHTTSVIGNGVALNIPVFFNELKGIVDRGVPAPKILISERAQVLMPYHFNLILIFWLIFFLINWKRSVWQESPSDPPSPVSHRSIQTNMQRSASR